MPEELAVRLAAVAASAAAALARARAARAAEEEALLSRCWSCGSSRLSCAPRPPPASASLVTPACVRSLAHAYAQVADILQQYPHKVTADRIKEVSNIKGIGKASVDKVAPAHARALLS